MISPPFIHIFIITYRIKERHKIAPKGAITRTYIPSLK
ncbi:Hypothetical protein LSJ_5033c (plasmid) [Ligilactobacillus salivarius]|uniref:Uncharacterized protein n=1 Tax=Ligilactobacillus salivarius TaxID=1624 RepID=A0A089QM25_9LACO|nr:Hypothetical protein LSJ_5033c [Ligilactobacillus salivarius]